MAGYMPFELVRPIMHRGPPPMPVVNIALVRPPEVAPLTTALKCSKWAPKSVDQIAQIVLMRENGITIGAIARIVGASRNTVRQYTAHLPPPVGGWKTGGHIPKAWNMAKAERMRRAGFTYAEIGDDLGCCKEHARKMLLGKKCRPHQVKPVTRLLMVISKVTGVPPQAIRSVRPGRVGKLVPNVCRARAILFWLAHEILSDETLSSIGKQVGAFQHSSVISGIRRVNALPGIDLVDRSLTEGRLARAIWSLDWSQVPR